MGLLLVPVPEWTQEQLEYEADGAVIIKFLTSLDEICIGSSRKRFSEFFVDGATCEPDTVLHSPEEGLEVINLLISHLREVQDVPENEELIQQLEILEDWLIRLEPNNRFYFVIA